MVIGYESDHNIYKCDCRQTIVMIHSIKFSEDEQYLIEQYASLHGMKISEVVRKATLEMIENEMDTQAFRRAKERFEKNPVTYSHEAAGKELGFL